MKGQKVTERKYKWIVELSLKKIHSLFEIQRFGISNAQNNYS